MKRRGHTLNWGGGGGGGSIMERNQILSINNIKGATFVHCIPHD